MNSVVEIGIMLCKNALGLFGLDKDNQTDE